MIQVIYFELTSNWIKSTSWNGLKVKDFLRRAELAGKNHVFEGKGQNIVTADPTIRNDLDVVERMHYFIKWNDKLG